ncbi:H-NS histone family protein [Massilia aquatica]|uniref:H-NS histone family protein n=1 Tax=Massilia aquatica TaxID=2609000 RepID=A0ABX0LVL1_9BURK|nr:H-NS histone family protein [Massilia aquatica]NHZ38577.1 H-NS histone family protein [Massilia aquatica]
MTKTVAELTEQYAKLENDFNNQLGALVRQIEAARKTEQVEATAKIKALMAQHGLSSADFAIAKPAKKGKASGAVAPKFRDDATGKTWTGRGRTPRWLTPENRDSYKID